MSAGDDILKDLHDRILKTLDQLRHDLTAVRTGRASLHLLDGVRVEPVLAPAHQGLARELQQDALERGSRLGRGGSLLGARDLGHSASA